MELDVHSELSRLLRRDDGGQAKCLNSSSLDRLLMLMFMISSNGNHMCQYRAVAIKFGVVSATGRGVRKVLEFRSYEIASENILGPKRCFSEARRQSLTSMNIYPFCPLRHIALVLTFRSFTNLTSHTICR